MKLRAKLILTAGGAALVTILVTAGILYNTLWSDRLEALRLNVARHLDSLDYLLGSFFDDVERDVAVLAAEEVVKVRDDRTFTNFLDADLRGFTYRIGPQERRIVESFNLYRLTHEFASSVYMGRENGSFVRSHPRAQPTRYDPRDRPWYVLAKRNRGRVMKTDPYPAVTTQDVNIGVVKALVNEGGEFYGVVGVDVTLTTLTEYSHALNYRLIPEGQFLLLDRNNLVLASRDKGMLFREAGAISEELSRTLRGERSGSTTVRVGGEKHYLFFREASREGWKSAVLVPYRYLEGQVRGTVLLTMGGVTLGLLLMGVSSLIALHVCVGRPIQSFTREVDRVAETGNLDRFIQVHSRDEFGALAKSFNNMLGALKQTQQRLMSAQQELRDHKDNLEGLVRERTRELAVAMEKAEESDRLKSAFLATMSHELRTPLNSIIGFTGILLQGLAGPLNQEQSKQLGMVRGSSRHLLELINDVLDISKIEAGQLQVVRERFDLRAMIEQVMRTVAPQVQKKGLVVVAGLTPEVGEIQSDRRRVEQILLNLLSNAIKFTERGEVRIDCRQRGEWLEIAVRDTGMGIRPEDVEKLFEPFRQLESGLGRRQEGTGLGLSICRRLVELLGGTIRVESVWGEGSTFTVSLPNRTARGGTDGADNPGDRG